MIDFIESELIRSSIQSILISIMSKKKKKLSSPENAIRPFFRVDLKKKCFDKTPDNPHTGVRSQSASLTAENV